MAAVEKEMPKVACLVLSFHGSFFPGSFLNMERHGFDAWTIQWIRNWLNRCSQGIVVNGCVSRCGHVLVDEKLDVNQECVLAAQ